MHASAEIDRRFMSFVTELLLCSRCLRHGVRTHVRQVISPHHRPRALCERCRSQGTWTLDFTRHSPGPIFS
jgi:hypothetical protein